MDTKRAIHLSKFLSLVLRHKPEAIGITLDSGGWVNAAELLAATERHGHVLSLDELRDIVATSDNKLFAFSEDGQKISRFGTNALRGPTSSKGVHHVCETSFPVPAGLSRRRGLRGRCRPGQSCGGRAPRRLRLSA